MRNFRFAGDTNISGLTAPPGLAEPYCHRAESQIGVRIFVPDHLWTCQRGYVGNTEHWPSRCADGLFIGEPSMLQSRLSGRRRSSEILRLQLWDHLLAFEPDFSGSVSGAEYPSGPTSFLFSISRRLS